jgi:hypothetical protein
LHIIAPFLTLKTSVRQVSSFSNIAPIVPAFGDTSRLSINLKLSTLVNPNVPI